MLWYAGTHAQIYLRPSDIGCQYPTSIYTTCLIAWQPRRAADTSTNWRQSLLYCCTASIEQAADGAETAAIDGLVSSWSENISLPFCLRSPGYGLTLWCALSLLLEVAIQVPQLQLQYAAMAYIHGRECRQGPMPRNFWQAPTLAPTFHMITYIFVQIQIATVCTK